MALDVFEEIMRKFIPYVDRLSHLTLHGLGEPLIDKSLSSKISIAAGLGFKGIGFATNASLLNAELSSDLLHSGLNTIIFSLDGIRASSYESVRRGLHYEDVVNNVLEFIRQRDQYGSHVKIVIRMIRQDVNRGEWPEYKEYWLSRLNPFYDDQIAYFDVYEHDCKSESYRQRLSDLSAKTQMICGDITRNIMIGVDGSYLLCCNDSLGVHSIGFIYESDPVDVYNSGVYKEYRGKMAEGLLGTIQFCSSCQVIMSQMHKKYASVR